MNQLFNQRSHQSIAPGNTDRHERFYTQMPLPEDDGSWNGEHIQQDR